MSGLVSIFFATREAGSVQVFGRRNDGSLHALRGPAAEKRQGRKSRVGSGGGAATMGISPRAQASMWWNVAATWAILPRRELNCERVTDRLCKAILRF